MKKNLLMLLALAGLSTGVFASCTTKAPSKPSGSDPASDPSGDPSSHSSYSGEAWDGVSDADFVQVTGWPEEVIQGYLAFYEIMGVEIPDPGSEDDWYYQRVIDSAEGDYMLLSTFDYGTIGVDSLEDKYKDLLTEKGWEVDDAYYEEYGYFAYYPGLESFQIQFYSIEDATGGEFDIYLLPLVEGSEDSSEGEPIDEGGLTKYTIDFTSCAEADADSGASNSFTNQGFTFSLTGGSGYNAGYGSNAPTLRVYAGASMTIDAGSLSIGKIEFVCTAEGDEKYGPGNFSVNKGSYTYSSYNGTWTGNANEVIFTSEVYQVRMASVTIYAA